MSSLKVQAIGSIKWSFLTELSGKAVTPIVYILLARMLSPDDFGVLSIAMIVISFSQIFWEAGLSKALIQRQTDIREATNVVFWINLLFGVLFLILLNIFSESVAAIFNDQRIDDVLKLMALNILFSSMSAVHIALLQKKFQFKKLFFVKLATVAIPGIFSLALAYNGYGYWSLVIGSIIGQLGQTIALWIISEWRPTLKLNKEIAGQLFNFGSWVMLGAFMGWLYTWMDSIIIAKFFTSHELGLYTTSITFVNSVFGILFTPIIPIIYAAFSKVSNLSSIKIHLLSVTKIFIYIAFPIGFSMLVLNNGIEDLIFNNNWSGIGFIVGAMALSRVIYWSTAANAEAFRAIGKPNIETRIMLIAAPVYLLVFYCMGFIGFEAIVYAKVLLPLVFGLFLQLYFGGKYFDIGVRKYISIVKFVLLYFVTFAFVFLKFLQNNLNIYIYIFCWLISLIFYGILILKFDEKLKSSLSRYKSLIIR